MPVFPEKAEQLFALFPNAEYDRLRRGTAQRFIFLWSRFAGAAEQDLRERAEQFRRRMAVVIRTLRQRKRAAGLHFHAHLGKLSDLRGDLPHSGDRIAVFKLLER